MSEQKPITKVPDGHARFLTTRQKEPNEKGFVGYETVWEPFQKEAEYETPKKAVDCHVEARTAARFAIRSSRCCCLRRNARTNARRAGKLEKIPLDSRAVSDVFMLAMGAYTPLDGFMGHDDWRGSCLDMKLADGVFWPIPITLSVNKDLADSIRAEEHVALADAETGEVLAIMHVQEKYSIDKHFEAEHVYRTTDPKHPGVAKVLARGCQSCRTRRG